MIIFGPLAVQLYLSLFTRRQLQHHQENESNIIVRYNDNDNIASLDNTAATTAVTVPVEKCLMEEKLKKVEQTMYTIWRTIDLELLDGGGEVDGNDTSEGIMSTTTNESGTTNQDLDDDTEQLVNLEQTVLITWNIVELMLDGTIKNNRQLGETNTASFRPTIVLAAARMENLFPCDKLDYLEYVVYTVLDMVTLMRNERTQGRMMMKKEVDLADDEVVVAEEYDRITEAVAAAVHNVNQIEDNTTLLVTTAAAAAATNPVLQRKRRSPGIGASCLGCDKSNSKGRGYVSLPTQKKTTKKTDSKVVRHDSSDAVSRSSIPFTSNAGSDTDSDAEVWQRADFAKTSVSREGKRYREPLTRPVTGFARGCCKANTEACKNCARAWRTWLEANKGKLN